MIQERRKALGYTQSALAKRINVSQQTVSHWESGKRRPSVEMLKKLADLFGCSIDELVR